MGSWVQIRGRAFDFWGGGGWGVVYGRFGLGKIFFYLHTSGDRIFSLTYKPIVWQPRPQGFSLTHFLREKPWGRGWLYGRYFLARFFFIRNQSAGYFFLKSPNYHPQKSKGRPLTKEKCKWQSMEFSRCSVLHALTFYLEIRQPHNFCWNDLQ